MLKSLRARNVALIAGVLLLAQALTMILVAALVIFPQADRVAGILANNIRMVGATLDALPETERDGFVERVNTAGAFRIQSPNGPPPGVDGRPTWLEQRTLVALAAKLGQRDMMVWRGGGGKPLWVRLRIGDESVFWVSLAPAPGWTPTGALAASVAIALFLSMLTGLVLQRRINRPLKALAGAVEAMPDARPMAPLTSDGPVEVRTVALAFERMAARLAAQDADRAFMLAGISHDLKTPLAKLRIAQALKAGADPEHDALIDRQFGRIDSMLGQFLDFGRGFDNEPVEAVPIMAALRNAIETLDAGDTVSVCGDVALAATVRRLSFERAIINVLRNALNHGAPPVTVMVTRERDNVRVVVEDCGPGVPEHFIATIDQPFVRGDEARSSDGGVGLGLAIVRRFASAHGGMLRFRRRDERGFAVILTLPLAA